MSIIIIIIIIIIIYNKINDEVRTNESEIQSRQKQK